MPLPWATMPDPASSSTGPATPPRLAQELASLARHGAVTVAACLLIAALLTLAGQGRWDVNLVYSLAIGLISWLTIDLGRHAFSRGLEMPWPGPWRGAALVVAGIAAGFVLGSLIGGAYHAHMAPDTGHSVMQRPWLPLAVTAIASVVMSLVFFLMGYSRHLQMQAEQARRQAAEARLSLLQAQLEPHMLFNTLANLRVLVGSDPQRAQAMLDHLIAYLRATLGGSRSTAHALGEEFARLQDYLALMSIRMGPRLRYTLELPEDLAGLRVPPLLLQPLVENGIRHGLEPKLEGGHIAVRARRIDGGGLELSVADDGMGLGMAAPATPGSRFGTAQLRERLASRYGDAARFELAALPEGGTLARITLTNAG